MSRSLFEFEKLTLHDDPGINIPCDHKHFLPCSSSSKELKIRLIFENHERLVYHYKNGGQLMGLCYLNSNKYLYANPFCRYCQIDIESFMLRSYLYKGKYRTMVELRPEIERLNNEARNKVQELIKSDAADDVEMIYDYKTTLINLSRYRFCDADEFSAWIADGNYVYINKITAVEGIVKVITGKEEASWLKFLKPWAYGHTTDDYLFWNKLPDINDIDTTCAICFGELLRKEVENYNTDPSIRVCLFLIEESLQSIVRLPCNCKHLFYEPCVLKWLYQYPVCPTCCYHIPSRHLPNIHIPFRVLPNLRLQDL